MTTSNKILWFMAMLFASANAFVGHGSDDGKLNPHKDICWDVSVYKPVDYTNKPCEKCHPTLKKTPVPKESEVCHDITTQKCDVVGYTECEAVMVPSEYKSQESGYDYFTPHSCIPIQMTVEHMKERPVCKNVTKQNCVTKWKIVDGKKVWSGNEDCKPVSWVECKPEKYPAPFVKDTVNCTAGNPIPYCNSCKTVLRPIMTTNYICKPKASLKCETVKTRRCTKVYWTDYIQTVVNNCQPDMAWIPSQEKSHEKRCLLDSDTGFSTQYNPPTNTGYNPPTPVYNPPTPVTTKRPVYHTPQPPKTSGGYGLPAAPVLSYGIPPLVQHG